MATSKPAQPKPRRATAAKAPTFQSRVDYVAKALQRGSWGHKFDECFEHHDDAHVIAAVMLRAQRNDTLRDAIISSFEVDSWDLVPWQEVAHPFAGKSAREIGRLAEEARATAQKAFREMYRNPELLMSQA